MPSDNLNRKPRSMADALRLIDQLRREILRRPRSICAELPSQWITGMLHDELQLDGRKNYTIEFTTGTMRYQFRGARFCGKECNISQGFVDEGEGHIVPT